MAGQAALAFTQTAPLRHLASIAGTVTLAFTADGDMSPGDIEGLGPVAFTPTGTLLAKGALAGSAALAFTPVAAFGAPGGLAAAVTLTFGASGDPFEGHDRGTLTGTGALLGVAQVAFGGAGVFVPNAMEADAAIAFSASATIHASGDFEGAAAALAFVASGTLINRRLVGATPLAFAGSGTLRARGALRTSTRLSLVAAANTGGRRGRRHRWPTHTQVGGLYR